MASKTITIKEEVYNLLVSLKREGESFSDLLERLAKESGTLPLLKSMKGSIDFQDKEEILSDIRRKREEWR